MTFQNPIAFVKRSEIDLTIAGETVTGFRVELEEMDAISERFPLVGKMIAGEPVEQNFQYGVQVLGAATMLIAASVAPDTAGADRKAVEASARDIDPAERAELFRQILSASFPQAAAVLESAEGNAPAKGNRQQRRAAGARSKGGGAKPQT